jgi:hypothetical protein
MLAARIRVDKPSVNWSKYSKPWDVIFDYPGFGIVRFIVRCLPTELPKGTPAPGSKPPELHRIYPSHQPLLENYSHSEIWAARGTNVIKRISSQMVIKEFQAIMSQESLVLRRPEV